MTAAEAIAQADALEPNQYTQAQKLVWLAELDGQIFHEILARHEAGGVGEGLAPPADTENGPAGRASPAPTEQTDDPAVGAAISRPLPDADIGPYETSSVLLVPSPWAGELYRWALIAQIRLHNAEAARYNQAAAALAAAWRAFADHCNRTRRPLGARRFRL